MAEPTPPKPLVERLATGIRDTLKPMQRDFLNRLPGKLSKNYDAKEYAAAYEKYMGSVGLGSGLQNEKNFSEWLSNKATLNDFAKMELPDGTSISKKLKNPTEALQKVQQELGAALKASPPVLAAQKDFEDNIKHMNDLLKEVPPKVNLGSIAGHLLAVKATAKTAIDTHQQQEKDAVTALFNSPTFIANLKTGLNLNTDQEVDAVKAKVMSTLDEKQKSAVSSFESGSNEQVNKLQAVQESEMKRIGYLVDKMNKDSAFRAQVYDMAQKRDANSNADTQVAVGYDPQNGFGLLKGINVSDFDNLYTNSGRRIIKNKDENDNDIYTVKFPNFANRLFYGFERVPNKHEAKLTKAEMRDLAETVRAAGHTKIEMSVTYKGHEPLERDQENEYAMELGRRAFEEAAMTGFDPKETEQKDPKDKDKTVSKCDITIKVNGRVKTAKELFASCPDRLQEIRNSANKAKNERKGYIEYFNRNNSDAGAIKKEITKRKEDAAAAEANPDAAAAPPAPGLGGA